ncbi:MAG: amino acid permease [Saprospiraceae bacterium]|nr:amino acid permease [Saprospiraceae bacterium]
MQQLDKIGWKSATALVVANMIGTGVFTSLGFQLTGTTNTISILILWALGGLIALAGAFAYAELGAKFPRSGGEYHYLSEIFHPSVGYLSGWVSITVGFAAPVALAAMALGEYVGKLYQINATLLATLAVVGVAIIHSLNLKSSSRFQNTTTFLKLVLIAGFILLGFFMPVEPNALDYSSSWKGEVLMPVFAISLVYVTYSYTGWNAAAYVVEEIKEPIKNLPKALIRGTLVVTVLYILLNWMFLSHAPIDQMVGKVEVGQVVAINVLGEQGGKIISIAIALFLVSSISAMVWVGPRVSLVMAEDYSFWKFLLQKNKNGIPVRAIWFQTAISLLMIWTGTFEAVLLYCGFILQLFSALTVAGVFFIDRKNLTYKNPTHPWFPALFLIISVWILAFLIYDKPFESLLGLSNLVVGYGTYLVAKRK